MPKKKFSLLAKIGKVHRVGGSLMVTLPDAFVKAHGISEGDQVGILANHILKIDPMKEGEFPVEIPIETYEDTDDSKNPD